jgi:CHAT domain-containing protein
MPNFYVVFLIKSIFAGIVLKYRIFGLVLFVFFVSCQKKDMKPNPYLVDNECIRTTLNKEFSINIIDTFITNGLYNLAFEVITSNKGKISNNQTLALANRFIENGEFDKGLSLANAIQDPTQKQTVLLLNLYGSLNKMDNVQAQVLLDSLLILNRLNPRLMNLVEIIMTKGYLAHNRKDYVKSVELNLAAIEKIKTEHLSDDILARAYHRIGNSYNDIVRDDIDFTVDQKTCLNYSIKYYQKELNLLIKNKSRNETKIALNYITTAMLLRGKVNHDNLVSYYKKALSLLIITNNKDFILTKNPIYTSIALTQLGSIYFETRHPSKMDSIFDINRKLIQLRSLYRIDEKQSLDVVEFFPQRSQEMKILFQLSNNLNKKMIHQKILELSNSCKYPNFNLVSQLHHLFGENYNMAVKNWIILYELKLFENIAGQKLAQLNCVDKLHEYNQKIQSIHLNQLKSKSTISIDLLLDYCKRQNTTIIDYQVLYGGVISILKIEPNGVTLNWLRATNSEIKVNIDALLHAAKSNQIEQYNKISSSLSVALGLQQIQTKRIVICPDENLEKLPFDALVINPNESSTWWDCNFIGKTHEIRLIPNMSFVMEKSETSSPLRIGIWTSDEDNESLPYNQKLIDQLVEKFEAQVNEDNHDNILHILAHTHRSADNRIQFHLNKDTITVYSSGFLKPKLVVLEGCSSGEGQNLKSEGSINLTRSFFYGGSESVIYSIWDADNQASTNLFLQFYRELSTGSNSSKALCKAKLILIKDIYHPEWANPYYWANFQLTGHDLFIVN